MDQDKIRMEILWQIASHPGIKKRPTVEQARKTLRLTGDDMLEVQLKWLFERGIVCIDPSGADLKAGPGSYRVCPTYSAYRYAYDLFKKRDGRKDFLKTIYSIEYTSSKGFLSKLLLVVFRNGVLALDEYIRREGLKAMIEQVKKRSSLVTAEEWQARMKDKPPAMSDSEYRGRLEEIDALEMQVHRKFLRSLRRLECGDLSDDFVRRYRQLVADMGNNDVDALPAVVAGRLGRAGGAGLGSQGEFLADYLLPGYEQANMSLMLSLSPSAVEYAMAPKYASSSLLASMASLLLNVSVPPEFFKPVSPYDIEGLYDGDVSPLYSIIKSAFLHDLMNDELIVKKGAETLVNEIFARKRVVVANAPAIK